MKVVGALAKTFILGVGLVSLVAVAETYYDQKFYTADFMDEVQEVRFNIPQDKDNRVVASYEKKLPLMQEVPMSMARLIDGNWQIIKVIDDASETVFESSKNNTNNKVIVEAKLIAPSIVRINDDIEQTYMVSLLTPSGTLALFKEFGDGYEIVEAVRHTAKLTALKKQGIKETDGSEDKELKKEKYNMEEDLFLVSALDPKKNRNVLRANDLEGYAYLRNGELILENIRLHVGTGNQTEALSTEARVKDHGTFNDERGTQGILTNISGDEIKVRFSTGPLAGAMLNFVTYNKKSKIEEKFGVATQREIPESAATPINAQTEAPGQYQEEAKQEVYDEEYSDDIPVNEIEEAYEQEYEEEYYEEPNGERINGEQMPFIDEDQAGDFEQMREESRYPSSIEPDKVGFSF